MEPVLLMSIKTKYAKQIFQGIKKYEFRRKSIGEKNCNKKIYIYSSKDDKAIIGYIIIDKILSGDINFVLKNTNSLNNQEIKNYFNNCSKCYALHISKLAIDTIERCDILANLIDMQLNILKKDISYHLRKKGI